MENKSVVRVMLDKNFMLLEMSNLTSVYPPLSSFEGEVWMDGYSQSFYHF